MGIDSFGSNKWTESCLEKGRMGLLQFKTSVQSINDDANWLLPSWVDDPQSDCCGWERVICNSTTRRITQLSLNNIRHVEYYTKLFRLCIDECIVFECLFIHPFWRTGKSWLIWKLVQRLLGEWRYLISPILLLCDSWILYISPMSFVFFWKKKKKNNDNFCLFFRKEFQSLLQEIR